MGDAVQHHIMISADADEIAAAMPCCWRRICNNGGYRARHAVPALHGVPDRMRDPRLAISPARRGAGTPGKARSPARRLPAGLRRADGSIRDLPARPQGRERHDENITVGRMREVLGADHRRARAAGAPGLRQGRDIAASRGIIIADTKFEFGRTARLAASC